LARSGKSPAQWQLTQFARRIAPCSASVITVAQMALYGLLNIDREIPPFLHHDKSLVVIHEAVITAFR